MPAAMRRVEEAGRPNGVVAFEHPFFAALRDGLFRMSEHTRAPAFAVSYGDVEGVLSFPAIRRELGLSDESADAVMLDLIGSALKFVSLLRIGDPLPAEVLTGEASWTVEPRHSEIALSRLTMQLVTWSTGEEAAITDLEALNQVVDDPATRAKAEQAVAAAAARVSMAVEDVKATLRSLAEELSYVEAMRERFQVVLAMRAKLDLVRRRAHGERSLLDIAHAVTRLMAIAVRDLQNQLEQVDAQTGEVVAMLKNPEAQVSYIRGKRDELYCRLVAWTDLLDRWGKLEPKASEQAAGLLRDTYRFLAPRYMPAQEWTLASKLLNRSQPSLGGIGPREIPNSMKW